MKFKFSTGAFVVFSVFALTFSACGGDSISSTDEEQSENVETISSSSKGKSNSSSKNKSSSSNGKSSSSSENQSSSSSLKRGMDVSVYDAQEKTLKDYRNEITYRTVEIGDQIWMSQNLNYDNGVGYVCGYGEDGGKSGGSCSKYGMLYTWDFAKTACPRNWHLPDSSEWITLINYAGGAEKAGIKLRACTNNRWDNSTDNYDFSALPAGAYNSETGRYSSAGYIACFWSSSEIDSSQAFEVQLNWSYDKALSHASSKIWGCSVRCIKDSD